MYMYAKTRVLARKNVFAFILRIHYRIIHSRLAEGSSTDESVVRILVPQKKKLRQIYLPITVIIIVIRCGWEQLAGRGGPPVSGARSSVQPAWLHHLVVIIIIIIRSLSGPNGT